MWRGSLTLLLLAVVACGDAGPAAPPADEAERPEPEAAYLARDLHDEDLGVRVRAAEVLATLGPDAAPAVPDLLPLARDADPRLREPAERAIRGAGVAAIPPLLEALAGEDWRDRAPAIKALAELGEAAWKAVLPLLEDPARRAGALEFLDRAGVPDDFDPGFLVALVGSEDEDVRLAATRLAARAARTEFEAALPALRAALRSDDAGLVVLAGEAIDEAGRAVPEAAADLAIACSRGNYHTTSALKRALRASDAATLDAVAAAIREHPDSAGGALDILAGAAPRRADYLDLYVECLGNEEGAGRLAAVRALCRCGDAAAPAVPQLQEILAEVAPAWEVWPASELVPAAARLVHRLDGEIPVSAFPAVLALDPQSEALGDLATRAGAEVAVPALVKALADDRRTIRDRNALLPVLGRFGAAAAPAADTLVALLRDDGADPLRVVPVLQGSRVDAEPLLRAALPGATGRGRLNVLFALSTPGRIEPGFEDAVFAAIGGDDYDLQERAADLLGRLGDQDPAAPEVLGMLVRLLRIDRSAYRALPLVERVGPPAEPALRAALEGATGAGRLNLLYALRAVGADDVDLPAALLAAFDSDELAAVAERLVRRLAEDDSAAPALPALLVRWLARGGEDPDEVVARLRKTGADPEPLLRDALAKADGAGRLNLLYALFALGHSEEAFEMAFAEALDGGGDLCWHAVSIIRSLALADAARPPVPRLLVRLVGDGLFDAEWIVRSLKEAGVDPAPLVRESLPGAAGAGRLGLLHALAILGGDDAPLRKAILAGLASEDEPTRRQAFRILQTLDPPLDEAAPLLLRLLDDPDFGHGAIEPILSLGPGALPALEGWLESHPSGEEGPWIRRHVQRLRERSAEEEKGRDSGG